jgi:hypothetical protein
MPSQNINNWRVKNDEENYHYICHVDDGYFYGRLRTIATIRYQYLLTLSARWKPLPARKQLSPDLLLPLKMWTS